MKLEQPQFVRRRFKKGPRTGPRVSRAAPSHEGHRRSRKPREPPGWPGAHVVRPTGPGRLLAPPRARHSGQAQIKGRQDHDD
jgi:hypothetical protein